MSRRYLAVAGLAMMATAALAQEAPQPQQPAAAPALPSPSGGSPQAGPAVQQPAAQAGNGAPAAAQGQPPAQAQQQTQPQSPQQAQQQTQGAADLCAELLGYAEKKLADARQGQQNGQQTGAGAQNGSSGTPPAQNPGGALKGGNPPTESHADAPRQDSQQSGTQGGGNTSGTSSSNTANQPAAPATAPTTTGAASEAATSPHATDQTTKVQTSANEVAGVSVDDIRGAAGRSDRGACRAAAQKMRRAGADMPASLIALAALDPTIHSSR